MGPPRIKFESWEYNKAFKRAYKLRATCRRYSYPTVAECHGLQARGLGKSDQTDVKVNRAPKRKHKAGQDSFFAVFFGLGYEAAIRNVNASDGTAGN